MFSSLLAIGALLNLISAVPLLNERQSSFRFLNPKTAPFQVKSLPDVPFNVGEMYSGNMPIKTGDKSRELFFVFQPNINAATDDITIWMNGGPGCSSLEGFFQENGRYVWREGEQPSVNPNSWVNLTNMLWVEQPVGTGYTVGTAIARTEEKIAQDFLGFFKNFQDTFGIKNFKVYVTGESYAGRYVPYISAAMLDAKNTQYFDLSGALVYDPCIGQYDYVQENVPVVPFVKENQEFFGFSSSFMSQIESLHESCGYADFIDKYLTFPPPGLQPQVSSRNLGRCDIFSTVNSQAQSINPCFNIYEVNQTCPTPVDVMSGKTPYFNRKDVKAAMHAPSTAEWVECSNSPVFTGGRGGPEQEGDYSLDPIQKVLPQVVEATNRVLVANGDYDMIIITNGTLLSIQNMTWNGALGFQEQLSTGIDIPSQGEMGIQHYERGLMWGQTYKSGHMGPEYQPLVSYRHLEWLLGKRESL
ncbi:serine carboxypeptidase [Tothia fuscella]|uniref:Carboxypeptidase n=1 Tax=Tothia fuscella TaxID=1048955 RepID=A0A9P4P369_9PEZI|nr:serine carboxypeptidase [Tothia fuscella]